MKHYHIIVRNSFRTIRRNRSFLRNFLSIIICMTCILFAFSLIIYQKTNNFMKDELLSSNNYQLEVAAHEIDSHIKDVAYQNSAIGINELSKAFFTSTAPEEIFTDFRSRVYNSLNAIVNGNPTVDSIYLYSETSSVLLSDKGTYTIEYYYDNSFMDHIEEGFVGTNVVFRAEGNNYPFFISAITQFDYNDHTNAVITNLDLNELHNITPIKSDSQCSLFIISDDGSILYRDRQAALMEDLSVEPMVSHFRSDTDVYSVLINDKDTPYTFSQYHSDYYSWSYVLVCHLPQYNDQLSANSATLFALCFGSLTAMILLAFIITSHATKPVQSILRFIQNPNTSITAELYSDSDIQYIANQIVQFSHQNEYLSSQLTTKLKILNDTKILALQSQINPHFLFNTLNMLHMMECEALGYDHPIPDITLKISKLFRYSVESTDMVSLDTEIEFTKTYISILLERYTNKPKIEYDICPDALSAIVPRLFIQPLIENAIHHGLISRENVSGYLQLSCDTDGEYCIVTVKDNGIGMESGKLESLRQMLNTDESPTDHIGLKNISSRMRLIYGEDFSILVDSIEGEGTTVVLRFPLII